MPACPDRWVLFELDGTLFDYAAAATAAVLATMRAASLEPTPDVLGDHRRANAEQWAALERGETSPIQRSSRLCSNGWVSRPASVSRWSATA